MSPTATALARRPERAYESKTRSADDLREPAYDGTRWTPGVGLPPAELRRFVLQLACAPERWRHLVRHEQDVRVYEQIYSDARVNAWLICWSGGQDTGFHDHDESAGAIAVISGQVRDERLVLGGTPRVREFAAGEDFAVPPTAIHRVLHSGERPAITIHAYSPPLLHMGAYRVGPDGELERQALTCEQELCAERGLDALAGTRATTPGSDPEAIAAAGAQDGLPASSAQATEDRLSANSAQATEDRLSPSSAGVATVRARPALGGFLSERVGLVSYRRAGGSSLALVAGGRTG